MFETQGRCTCKPFSDAGVMVQDPHCAVHGAPRVTFSVRDEAALAAGVPSPDERFEAHTRAVAEFLNELYATMVDPLADGTLTVSEMCQRLLAQARKDREALAAGVQPSVSPPASGSRNEWRLDDRGALDDVVVDDVATFRMERMSDDHVWGAIYHRDGSRTDFNLFGDHLSWTHEPENSSAAPSVSPVPQAEMGTGSDVALETARDILDQSVCECGHVDSEHSGRRETVYSPPDGECHGDGCECRQFAGVEFTVARSGSPAVPQAWREPQDWQERPIQQLRATLSMLCHFIWHRRIRPGEHMWSIPVDKERDFDCILSDAITELEQRRARSVDTVPDFWLCKACGCLWRDNHDGSVSLGSAKQTSCPECEHMPMIVACEPLWRQATPVDDQTVRARAAALGPAATDHCPYDPGKLRADCAACRLHLTARPTPIAPVRPRWP